MLESLVSGYISCFSMPDKKEGRVLFWLTVCGDTVYDEEEDMMAAEGSVMVGVHSRAPHLLTSWWNVNILREV